MGKVWKVINAAKEWRKRHVRGICEDGKEESKICHSEMRTKIRVQKQLRKL